jgi:hypothetical protein
VRLPAAAKWLGLALIGLLVAAAVAIAAGRLASQQIGLASEPITAGDRLAPAVTSPHRGGEPGGRRHPAHAQAPTTTGHPPATTVESPSVEPPPPPAEPQSPADDSGGEAGGGGADD